MESSFFIGNNSFIKVEIDDEVGVLYGEVINVRDVITFEGTSVEEVQQAFYESVDDYLEFCAERGESPEKPFSGKFVLRLPEELHRQAYIQAKLKNKSLNSWVTEVLQRIMIVHVGLQLRTPRGRLHLSRNITKDSRTLIKDFLKLVSS